MHQSSTARNDSVILEIAGRQHGVVARRQLLEAGLSAREVQYRLETGRLRRVHRGVYAAGPVSAEQQRRTGGEYRRRATGVPQRRMAAVLACGDRCHVGYRSAAACWGLLAARPGRPVDIVTVRDVRWSDPGIRVHRVSGLDADEVTTQDRLPLTTPARTLLDLAGRVGAGELERALARALHRRLAESEEIRRLLGRYPRRPGRGRLNALLSPGARPAFTRSEAERVFLELIRSGGLPRPETNVVTSGLEVDCLWRRERLVVEVDGRRYHADSRSFEHDRGRDATLVAAGYRVMRVTWKQITETPRTVLVRVAAALARGER